MKLIIVLYVIVSAKHLSSPSSDIPAMLFVLWIQCKWLELIGSGEDEEVPYIFLCLVSVYAVTVKLSVLTCTLLIFYPLILLAKKREWVKIIVSALGCLIIVLPFLIRNAIISGYLLYPYAKIDLFNVDWKMPASVAEHDAMEIAVWGRGLNDVNKYQMSILEWFPQWFRGLEIAYKVLFLICMIAVVIAAIYIIHGVIKKTKKYALLLLLGTEIMAIFFWLFSAPLIRYGWVFMIALPSTLLYIFLDRLGNKQSELLINKACGVALYFCLSLVLIFTPDNMDISVMYQREYENKPTIETDFYDMIIWIPAEEWRTGYEPFPSMLYPEQLNNIELRGSDFSMGFKMKEEKKELHLMNDGYEW